MKIGHAVSDYFMCKVGVTQCENLLLFLFSVYINGLKDYLVRKSVTCFNCPNAVTDN